jgi:hypothetical protein
VRCANSGLGVLAPIAPGLVTPVGIDEHGLLAPGRPMQIRTEQGCIALDGEREIELNGHQTYSVTLELDGPLTLDVPATLAAAVRRGAMVRDLIRSAAP